MFAATGLNILIGDNGQGKTNYLEAIYVLATTRSFKTAKLQEAVRFGQETAIIRGRVRQSEDIHREMQAALQGNTKTFLINGKRESVQQYLGQLHAVVFNSDELDIVRGQPDARRRFLDGADRCYTSAVRANDLGLQPRSETKELAAAVGTR